MKKSKALLGSTFIVFAMIGVNQAYAGQSNVPDNMLDLLDALKKSQEAGSKQGQPQNPNISEASRSGTQIPNLAPNAQQLPQTQSNDSINFPK